MSNVLDCQFCEKPVECNESFEQYQEHLKNCEMRPILARDVEELRRLVAEEFVAMRKEVAEIHAFIANLTAAMNNPMLKAMLPPQYRGMLGG
jgi:hypothetical protein